MSKTNLVPETTTELSHGNGDHDRFAHFVQKDEATEAMVYGNPVVALCGKVWVPSRDPEKYPICPMCKELYEHFSA